MSRDNHNQTSGWQGRPWTLWQVVKDESHPGSTKRKKHCQLVTNELEQPLQPRLTAGHLPVVARLGRLLSDRSTRADPRAGTRRQTCTNFASRFPTKTRDDGFARNAGPSTADNSHDPAPLPENAVRENTVSKTKESAAYEAMEAVNSARARQEDARRIYGQRCNEAAVAETNSTNARQDVLGKAEALEKHVGAVTMRAGLPLHHAEQLPPNDPRAARRSL